MQRDAGGIPSGEAFGLPTIYAEPELGSGQTNDQEAEMANVWDETQNDDAETADHPAGEEAQADESPAGEPETASEPAPVEEEPQAPEEPETAPEAE